MNTHEGKPTVRSLADFQAKVDAMDPKVRAREHQRIGQNVRRARLARRWTQSDLAREMVARGDRTWSQATVSRVENGRQELRFAESMNLQEVLGSGIWEGTAMAATAQTLVDAVMSEPAKQRATVRALQEAHEALVQAEQTVRALRSLHDPSFKDEE